MKNLEAHTAQLKADRNPGHEIGTFLLSHSNSVGYLVSQLEGYLEALKADAKAEANLFINLHRDLLEDS